MNFGSSDKRSAFSRQAGVVITLAVLAGVGYYGHHTGWSLPGSLPGSGSTAAPADTAGHHSGDATLEVRNPLRVDFDSPEAIDKSGISTVTVRVQPMSEEVIANGVVGYDQRQLARISTRVAGTVWRVNKHWGDLVQKGEILALIEAAEVGRLKAEFLAALVASESRSDQLRMMEKAGSAIAERQLREARLAVREERIRLLNSEQALVNLGLPVRMEDFEGLSDIEQAELIHFIGLPEELAKSLDPDATTSNLLPVAAPFDGVVIGRDIGLGEFAETAKPLFEIADVRRMWVNLQIPKEDSPKVLIGQDVSFRVDGVPAELRSKVTWISTEVDEHTRTLQVRAEVDNPVAHPHEPSGTGQRLLRANTFGTGRIRIRTVAGALVVPNECLHDDGDEQLIFVQIGERSFEGRPVTKGITQDQFTEIQGNITEGDVVAARGSHTLKSQVVLSRLASH